MTSVNYFLSPVVRYALTGEPILYPIGHRLRRYKLDASSQIGSNVRLEARNRASLFKIADIMAINRMTLPLLSNDGLFSQGAGLLGAGDEGHLIEVELANGSSLYRGRSRKVTQDTRGRVMVEFESDDIYNGRGAITPAGGYVRAEALFEAARATGWSSLRLPTDLGEWFFSKRQGRTETAYKMIARMALAQGKVLRNAPDDIEQTEVVDWLPRVRAVVPILRVRQDEVVGEARQLPSIDTMRNSIAYRDGESDEQKSFEGVGADDVTAYDHVSLQRFGVRSEYFDLTHLRAADAEKAARALHPLFREPRRCFSLTIAAPSLPFAFTLMLGIEFDIDAFGGERQRLTGRFSVVEYGWQIEEETIDMVVQELPAWVQSRVTFERYNSAGERDDG